CGTRRSREDLVLVAGGIDMARIEGFAEALGFASYEDLVEESEVIFREGDIYWYVTCLPGGRWAAWDDAEISLDRVMYFNTRGEAVVFHLSAYAEKYGEEMA